MQLKDKLITIPVTPYPTDIPMPLLARALTQKRMMLDDMATEARGQPFQFMGEWFHVDPIDGTIKGGRGLTISELPARGLTTPPIEE